MVASVTVAAQVPPAMRDEIHAWMDGEFGKFGPSRSEAIRHLLRRGLDADRSVARKQEQLLLPPPASAKATTPHTLTELAALIRAAAETNPFVRPLADLLEGRI